MEFGQFPKQDRCPRDCGFYGIIHLVYWFPKHGFYKNHFKSKKIKIKKPSSHYTFENWSCKRALSAVQTCEVQMLRFHKGTRVWRPRHFFLTYVSLAVLSPILLSSAVSPERSTSSPEEGPEMRYQRRTILRDKGVKVRPFQHVEKSGQNHQLEARCSGQTPGMFSGWQRDSEWTQKAHPTNSTRTPCSDRPPRRGQSGPELREKFLQQRINFLLRYLNRH